MKLVIPKGSTSRIITVFIQANNVTTGAGLASLIHTSGIVGGFVREGGTGVALAVDEDVTTEGTYDAPSAAGKVKIGTPANMRAGTYELHFHNDLWATGAETVTITLGGATNMADLAIEVQLSDPVRGLGAPTALPNAAAGASNGLIVLVADWLTAAGVSAAAANKLADHSRRRTQANVESSSDGDALDYGSLYGLIQQGQESNTVDSPGNLRVYRTNGSTILATRPITTDATADPVTGIS